MPMYRERSKRVEVVNVSANAVGRLRTLGAHMADDGWGVIEDGRIRIAIAPGDVVVNNEGALKVISADDLTRRYEPDA